MQPEQITVNHETKLVSHTVPVGEAYHYYKNKFRLSLYRLPQLKIKSLSYFIKDRIMKPVKLMGRYLHLHDEVLCMIVIVVW